MLNEQLLSARWLDAPVTRLFEGASRVLLSLLIVAILFAILAGIGYTIYDLRLVFGGDAHAVFRAVLVDVLTVLAMVEVLRTALAYFTEGRVKVTYIIDTVIVTVLTEIMAIWYRDVSWQKLAMVLAVVISLALVRIVAVRFSPRRAREEL
ncbi:MAG: phosphate-starvation-inducible PsiE family protein [Anaeromyxobacteraceae bacterium]